MKTIVILMLGLLLVFTACTTTANQEITCNSPYIKVGDDCCVDANYNRICDYDESYAKTSETTTSTDGNVDLTIYVEDEDRDEIRNAKVVLDSSEGYYYEETDTSGDALFRDIEVGCYDVKISHSDYKTEHDTVCVRENEQNTERRFYLEYNLDAKLIVRVLDRETAAKIESARVQIESENNDEEDTEYTDEDGEAEFTHLTEKCYDIEVYKSGYGSVDSGVCFKDSDDAKTRYFYLEK